MLRGSRPTLAWPVLMGLGALILCMAGCGVAAQPEPRTTLEPTSVPQPIDLTVMYTSDTVGSTEPCG